MSVHYVAVIRHRVGVPLPQKKKINLFRDAQFYITPELSSRRLFSAIFSGVSSETQNTALNSFY